MEENISNVFSFWGIFSSRAPQINHSTNYTSDDTNGGAQACGDEWPLAASTSYNRQGRGDLEKKKKKNVKRNEL
jgi:hypothetical protein